MMQGSQVTYISHLHHMRIAGCFFLHQPRHCLAVADVVGVAVTSADATTLWHIKALVLPPHDCTIVKVHITELDDAVCAIYSQPCREA